MERPEGQELRSLTFRRERQTTWRELERLVAKVDRGHLRDLTARELSRLPGVYRATLSSLSVARSISLDRNLVEYLESLCGRAYFCVYGPRRTLAEMLRDFFVRGFPETARRHRWKIALSASFLILGTVAGMVLTSTDPDRFYAFVDENLAQGRGPSAKTESLREVLYDHGTPTDSLITFATFLFTHNARVGILAFAIGGLAGIPVALLLFTTGLMLGAFAALYQGRGLGIDLWGWLLPHGVTELLAVVICGAAGLAVAQALVFPGRHSRYHNLATRGRDAGVLVMGAVVMFLAAGLIEGIFRQTVTNVLVRYLVAASTAVLLWLYFTRVGRSTTS